jgi:RHH-type proline utilization regulon transcriptional repressor/proline dehydrogenase/delta 1-pyrroline-5-carboxylate dehydrogenase
MALVKYQTVTKLVLYNNTESTNMIFATTNHPIDASFKPLNSLYRHDESACIEALLIAALFTPEASQRIYQTAEKLVLSTRKNRKKQTGLDSFLHQYDLSSEEGIALMCLAEALLRIPDSYTVDRLISDKISTADWNQHLGNSSSLFVNAATWSLMLTGKIYAPTLSDEASLTATLKRLFARTSSNVIRPIVMQSMKILGKQFVMGRNINEALKRAETLEAKGYRYSYDMLGEAARTAKDADKYFQAYEQAIAAIGFVAKNQGPVLSPGISIKLSALHPRYEYAKRERVWKELVPRLLSLAKQAKAQNIGLTVDAEEADRLELSLEIFKNVFVDPELDGWEGFGLAVQSYQKRAPAVIDWLIQLSHQQQRRIMVRLIKGAYWDAEIKQSQVLGLEGYPVFTRKNSTDVSFLACAKKLLANPDCFYPQFGTHNAHSVAAILEIAGTRRDFEFQCLHGMGQPLYDEVVGAKNFDVPCRIYAPVGNHIDLLGYLVRRLLENGANTSFINRIADEKAPLDKIIADPVARITGLAHKPHPHIPLPENIYGSIRKNARGLDLSNSEVLSTLKIAMEQTDTNNAEAAPIVNGKFLKNTAAKPVFSPAQTDKIVGYVSEATANDVEAALQSAIDATSHWGATPVAKRAACLEHAADLLETQTPAFMTLLCREAGKQIVDCQSEIREAIDFCRYYAARAREDLKTEILPGPTGESNQLLLHPRGVIVCISPWNFPLAIFLGQITAALAAGNTVIAKPAEQTPLVAAAAIKLLLQAGIPKDALHLLPGQGEVVGAKLVADERIAGVMFTGSTETAKRINQTLANRAGAIVPFIAETGGQNAMIVDSSALPEQVVADILHSSFNSAGQRCSALRVVFLQQEIADKVLEMLQGAMAELTIGDPSLLATDVGPVIDADALATLEKHAQIMRRDGKLVFQASLPASSLRGYFFAPCVFELDNLAILPGEVFGPILHVIRYKSSELDNMLAQIAKTGYGLTMGIHSRIDATIKYIKDRISVGNLYVNRNMIGAVVGVQPFGGEKMSGTGPKAGGPHYLARLCVERAISINTSAAGGNTTLVSLSEEN